ncbi:MAG: sel1 repeat family protein, partial [Neisseria sicca]|nr:sel1 repeat family protein [Neisseria sicca]
GQGHAKAQYNLGGMYANGKGVLQNLVQAEQWYRKAAEQGIAEAQYNLGVMYDNGQGVRQNYKIAKEWFGKACDNGIQLGCDAYRELNQAGY